MARLIINPTSSSRREIVLARTLLSVGRDPSNDLVLPDAMVSRRHAVVEFRGGQYYIRDCNSSNGSLVNGDRISERNLRDGDLVAIGTARLLFREDYEEEAGGKVVQHPSAPRLSCPTCQADHRQGDAFCRQCGATLAPAQPSKLVCTSCGTVVPLPARFCSACGTTLMNEVEALEVTKPRPIDELAVGGPRAEAAPRDASSAPPAARASQGPVARDGRASDPDREPASRPAHDAVARRAPESASRPGSEPAVARGGGGSAGTVDRPADARVPARPSSPGSSPSLKQVPVSRAEQGPGRPDPGVAPAERPTAQFARSAAAPVGPRFGAGLLDALAVAVAMSIVVSPAAMFWYGRDPAAPVDFLPIVLTLSLVPLAVALGALYYVYHWGVKGATPGQRLLGLAVEGTDGQSPIGIGRAGVRFLAWVLSGALFGIGFLMILFGGQALHDRISDTRVVRARS